MKSSRNTHTHTQRERECELTCINDTQVTNEAGWFEFMEQTFPGIVVPTEYYNGDKIEGQNLGQVNGDFLLLGAISARQVRVMNNT